MEWLTLISLWAADRVQLQLLPGILSGLDLELIEKWSLCGLGVLINELMSDLQHVAQRE